MLQINLILILGVFKVNLINVRRNDLTKKYFVTTHIVNMAKYRYKEIQSREYNHPKTNQPVTFDNSQGALYLS